MSGTFIFRRAVHPKSGSRKSASSSRTSMKRRMAKSPISSVATLIALLKPCFYRELETALGPSVQTLGGIRPFVTWDGLSSKSGAGQTLDYIFVRAHVTLKKMDVVPQVVFYTRNPRDRLSDHFGLEAVVSLNPAPVIASLPASISVGLALPRAGLKSTSE